jgi:hypothetical protein
VPVGGRDDDVGGNLLAVREDDAYRFSALDADFGDRRPVANRAAEVEIPPFDALREREGTADGYPPSRRAATRASWRPKALKSGMSPKSPGFLRGGAGS